jgi:hypothetical protein
MKYVETKLKFSAKNVKDLWRQIETILEFSTIIKSLNTFPTFLTDVVYSSLFEDTI